MINQYMGVAPSTFQVVCNFRKFGDESFCRGHVCSRPGRCSCTVIHLFVSLACHINHEAQSILLEVTHKNQSIAQVLAMSLSSYVNGRVCFEKF